MINLWSNDKKHNSNAVNTNLDSRFVVTAIILIIILILLPTGFKSNQYVGSIPAKVEILSVDNDAVHSSGGIVLQGHQLCRVKVLDGPFNGQENDAVNIFMGKLEVDKIFETGDKALATLDYQDDTLEYVTLIDHYRLGVEMFLFLAFAILLILYARTVGIKAVISFILTILAIWKIMIPMFLKGFSPVIVALFVVLFLTVIIVFLVTGVNQKGIIAIAGSFLGTFLTCILALLFGHFFKIHGSVMPYSESLLYSGFAHLKLTEIFIAGIFIASSGALMDIAVDISVSLYELVENNPQTTRQQATKSGFTIGRSIVGTMTTTLLLAYSGGYVALLMVFMAQGTPVLNILNLRFVAAEILHTLVGSFGLVAVAPFTALLAGYFYTHQRHAGK